MRFRTAFLKKLVLEWQDHSQLFSTCPCTWTEFLHDELKAAFVCPFKGGCKATQDPTNNHYYDRPISLTSCVLRTMKKLVNNQTQAYLSTNSLLHKHQSGFLPNHLTVAQLRHFSHQWQMALEKGEQVHAVFLDLSKARTIEHTWLTVQVIQSIWVFQTYNGVIVLDR